MAVLGYSGDASCWNVATGAGFYGYELLRA